MRSNAILFITWVHPCLEVFHRWKSQKWHTACPPQNRLQSQSSSPPPDSVPASHRTLPDAPPLRAPSPTVRHNPTPRRSPADSAQRSTQHPHPAVVAALATPPQSASPSRGSPAPVPESAPEFLHGQPATSAAPTAPAHSSTEKCPPQSPAAPATLPSLSPARVSQSTQPSSAAVRQSCSTHSAQTSAPDDPRTQSCAQQRLSVAVHSTRATDSTEIPHPQSARARGARTTPPAIPFRSSRSNAPSD